MVQPPSRLLADRRTGVDRRVGPRRHVVMGALAERRAVAARRRGAERRSTLERRGRGGRRSGVETPGEHLRNALQLLKPVAAAAAGSPGFLRDLDAAIERIARALALLERR